MNLSPRKALNRPPNAASSWIILPEELITELLSFLPVKSLMRFKCCCKSWETLISDPSFIKLHLQRSTRNPQLALARLYRDSPSTLNTSVLPISSSHLLDSPSKSITHTNDPYYLLKDKDCTVVVGSCNGLLCLFGCSFMDNEMWLRFWNPATRTISKKLGNCPIDPGSMKRILTYKVVALDESVRVFSLGDNVWRNIHLPAYFYLYKGVHLNGSVNFLAIRDYVADYYDPGDITVEQVTIISLDLRTETYKEFIPPRGFDQKPYVEPSLFVLMDCLCFSEVVKETHFVIWKMTDYGVEESWTHLLKISFQIIKFFYHEWLPCFPLHLSKNHDTLILEGYYGTLPIVFNLRDGSLEQIKITNGQNDRLYMKNYVESLVLCH